MNSKKIVGYIALFISAFLWATAFIVVKNLVDDIPPSLLLATRYTIAAIVITVMCIPKFRLIDKALLKCGIKMGCALFVEFYSFTLGVKYTTATRASLIIASYIIMLPIVYYFVRKKKPTRADIIGALLCMVGLAFIVGGEIGAFGFGDILCFGSALGCSFHVVWSAQYAKQYDSMLLNMMQISVTAVIAIIVTLCTGSIRFGLSGMPWGAVIYLAIVCTITPYLLTLLGMKRVSTTASGILLSFENVFAPILAALVLHEQMTWQIIVGGIIIVISFILTEVL